MTNQEQVEERRDVAEDLVWEIMLTAMFGQSIPDEWKRVIDPFVEKWATLAVDTGMFNEN